MLVRLRFGPRRWRRGFAREHHERLIGRWLRDGRADEIQDDGVAVLNAPDRHGLETCRALAQVGQRLVYGGVTDRRALLVQGDRRVVARLDGRNRLERGGEFERLPLFDHDIPDVRRIDRLDAALAERFIHGPRDQPVRDVVQNLIAKTLAHDLGRHLARPEARHARGPAVVPRHLVYFRVDDRARDLDDEIFLRIADVNEFCLHLLSSSGSGLSKRCQVPGQVRLSGRLRYR